MPATQGLTCAWPTGRPGTPITENALQPPVGPHDATPVETSAVIDEAPIAASAWSIAVTADGSLSLLVVSGSAFVMITRSLDVSFWTAASSWSAPARSLPNDSFSTGASVWRSTASSCRASIWLGAA